MNYFDLQQLAGAALGMNEVQTDAIIDGNEDFDTPLTEKFGIDFEQFSEVAQALLPLTPTVQSPLTGTIIHAFVRQLGDGKFLAIAKMKAKEQPRP